MDVNSRIRKFLKAKSITVQNFEMSIGRTNGYLAHTKSPTANVLSEVMNVYPELNIGWLLTGKGEMLKDNAYATGIAVSEDEHRKNEVYLYDVSAAAGYGSFDEIISKEKIVAKYVVPAFDDISWMIFVKGSSMYPKYSSGDIVACRVIHESRFIQWGKVYVVATREQGLLVKRLKKSAKEDFITAVSDNTAYDPFDIPKDEILGIALVIGVIRME